MASDFPTTAAARTAREEPLPPQQACNSGPRRQKSAAASAHDASNRSIPSLLKTTTLHPSTRVLTRPTVFVQPRWVRYGWKAPTKQFRRVYFSGKEPDHYQPAFIRTTEFSNGLKDARVALALTLCPFTGGLSLEANSKIKTKRVLYYRFFMFFHIYSRKWNCVRLAGRRMQGRRRTSGVLICKNAPFPCYSQASTAVTNFARGQQTWCLERIINKTRTYVKMNMDRTRFFGGSFLMLNGLSLKKPSALQLDLLPYEQYLPSSAPDRNASRSLISVFSHRITKRLRVTEWTRYAPTQQKEARLWGNSQRVGIWSVFLFFPNLSNFDKISGKPSALRIWTSLVLLTIWINSYTSFLPFLPATLSMICPIHYQIVYIKRKPNSYCFWFVWVF